MLIAAEYLYLSYKLRCSLFEYEVKSYGSAIAYPSRVACTLYILFRGLASWLADTELFSSEEVAAGAESLIHLQVKYLTGTGRSHGVATTQND